jgi:alkyldihydroxyacetonephosphate synthase
MNTPALTAAGIAWSADPLDLDAARRDLWPRDSLRLRAGERPPAPALVAWPRSRADVALLLRWAEEEGRPVVPYGAGSGVCGGAQGVEGALVIDLKRMRRLLQVDAAAGTAHVEAGMLGQHLEDALAPLGWKTAHSPSSIHCSTVGGYVAARSAGQFSSRFGVFEDMLLAAHAETPTGPMDTGLWTPQGSEDLQAVLLGSEGGLGVITDVLVKLAPLPHRWWLRGFAFPSLEAAWSAMRGLMQAGLWPSALRLYDPVDTRLPFQSIQDRFRF